MDRSFFSTLSSTSSRSSEALTVSSSAFIDQSFSSTSSKSSKTSLSSYSASTASTEDFWLQYKRNKRTPSLWKLLRSRLSPTPSVSSKSVTAVTAVKPCQNSSLEQGYFYSEVAENNVSSKVSCQEDYEDVFEEYSNFYLGANIDSLDLPPPLPLKHHQIRAPARPPVTHL